MENYTELLLKAEAFDFIKIDALCRLVITDRANIYEIRIPRLSMPLLIISFGIPVLIAAAVPFFWSFSIFFGIFIWLSLPIVAWVVFSIGCSENQRIGKKPLFIFDRNTKTFYLKLQNKTICSRSVVALHILKGWYKFDDSWIIARISELTVIIKNNKQHERYHLVAGSGTQVNRIAEDLNKDLDVPVIVNVK